MSKRLTLIKRGRKKTKGSKKPPVKPEKSDEVLEEEEKERLLEEINNTQAKLLHYLKDGQRLSIRKSTLEEENIDLQEEITSTIELSHQQNTDIDRLREKNSTLEDSIREVHQNYQLLYLQLEKMQNKVEGEWEEDLVQSEATKVVKENQRLREQIEILENCFLENENIMSQKTEIETTSKHLEDEIEEVVNKMSVPKTIRKVKKSVEKQVKQQLKQLELFCYEMSDKINDIIDRFSEDINNVVCDIVDSGKVKKNASKSNFELIKDQIAKIKEKETFFKAAKLTANVYRNSVDEYEFEYVTTSDEEEGELVEIDE